MQPRPPRLLQRPTPHAISCNVIKIRAGPSGSLGVNTIMRSRVARLLALGIPVTLGSVQAVYGQELEEVTVTAQKREQDLQQVTLAITALTGDEIEKQGMLGFRQWADHVPGITVVQGQDPSRRTGPSATIRGITQVYRGQLWEVSSGATTVFTVGQVPFMNGDPGLYDMSRIEVLRG